MQDNAAALNTEKAKLACRSGPRPRKPAAMARSCSQAWP